MSVDARGARSSAAGRGLRSSVRRPALASVADCDEAVPCLSVPVRVVQVVCACAFLLCAALLALALSVFSSPAPSPEPSRFSYVTPTIHYSAALYRTQESPEPSPSPLPSPEPSPSSAPSSPSPAPVPSTAPSPTVEELTLGEIRGLRSELLLGLGVIVTLTAALLMVSWRGVR